MRENQKGIKEKSRVVQAIKEGMAGRENRGGQRTKAEIARRDGQGNNMLENQMNLAYMSF